MNKTKDNSKYQAIKIYFDPLKSNKILKTNLTKKQAKDYCKKANNGTKDYIIGYYKQKEKE